MLPELLLEEELEDELELLLEDDELDEELLDEEELEDELDPLLDEELELPDDDEELELELLLEGVATLILEERALTLPAAS